MGLTYLLDIDGMLLCYLIRENDKLRHQVLRYCDLNNLISLHPFLTKISSDDEILSGSYRTDLELDLAGVMNNYEHDTIITIGSPQE